MYAKAGTEGLSRVPRCYKAHNTSAENFTICSLCIGKGMVKNIMDGGRDYEVTVDFEGYGVKKMFASFAKLKRI